MYDQRSSERKTKKRANDAIIAIKTNNHDTINFMNIIKWVIIHFYLKKYISLFTAWSSDSYLKLTVALLGLYFIVELCQRIFDTAFLVTPDNGCGPLNWCN